MPVVEFKGSQCPAYRVPMQTLLHVQIHGDVLWVIIVNKLETDNRVINEQREYKEQQGQKLPLFFGGPEKLAFRKWRRSILFFCNGGVQPWTPVIKLAL